MNKEELKNLLKPENYHYFGLWKQDLYSAWFWVNWNDQALAKKFGIPLEEGGVYIVNGHFAIKKTVLEKVKQIFQDKIDAQDVVFFEAIHQQAQEILEEAKKSANEYVNTAIGAETFRRYLALGRSVMFPWCLFVLLSYSLDEALTTKAKKEGIQAKDISSLIPSAPTLLTQEHEAALALRAFLEKKGLWQADEDSHDAWERISLDREAGDRLSQFADEYGWLEMANFLGEPMTVEQALKRLQTITIHAPRQNVQQELSASLKFLTRIAQHVSQIRQLSAEYFALFSCRTKPYLEKLAKEVGVPYRDLLCALPEEIEGALKSHESLKQEIINQRKQHGYAITMTENEVQVWDKKEVVKWIEELFVPVADKQTNIVKGITAQPGYAKGKAKIILNTDEFKKMTDGDVLITTMTTPDFVVLMQRSCAIVTDIGGLLSHAAIVSREMGKPCVIGTKFATQVFQDQDEVEVDATSATVTKQTP